MIEGKKIPGISVLVGRGREILIKKEMGNRALEPQIEELSEDTVYDVASLTKPFVTAFLTLYLIENDKLTLNDDVNRFFRSLHLEGITIKHLLTHTSGLTDWYPFYLSRTNPLKQLTSIKRYAPPGRKVLYSCVGYILLYFILRKVLRREPNEFIKKILFDRVGAVDTFFHVPENIKYRVAPTELGNIYEKQMASRMHKDQSAAFDWREYMIRGEVHDANSFYLGGTGGNAGLFTTSSDLFKLSREFFTSTATILKPETIRLFWENMTSSPVSQRSAGFKLNSSLISSGGKSLSKRAIGHSGFTGVSIWMEPDTNLVFIILSNRIHPVVRNIPFNRIRRKIHSLLKDAL